MIISCCLQGQTQHFSAGSQQMQMLLCVSPRCCSLPGWCRRHTSRWACTDNSEHQVLIPAQVLGVCGTDSRQQISMWACNDQALTLAEFIGQCLSSVQIQYCMTAFVTAFGDIRPADVSTACDVLCVLSVLEIVSVDCACQTRLHCAGLPKHHCSRRPQLSPRHSRNEHVQSAATTAA